MAVNMERVSQTTMRVTTVVSRAVLGLVVLMAYCAFSGLINIPMVDFAS
jgi:hypothetical protein